MNGHRTDHFEPCSFYCPNTQRSRSQLRLIRGGDDSLVRIPGNAKNNSLNRTYVCLLSDALSHFSFFTFAEGGGSETCDREPSPRCEEDGEH